MARRLLNHPSAQLTNRRSPSGTSRNQRDDLWSSASDLNTTRRSLRGKIFNKLAQDKGRPGTKRRVGWAERRSRPKWARLAQGSLQAGVAQWQSSGARECVRCGPGFESRSPPYRSPYATASVDRRTKCRCVWRSMTWSMAPGRSVARGSSQDQATPSTWRAYDFAAFERRVRQLC